MHHKFNNACRIDFFQISKYYIPDFMLLGEQKVREGNGDGPLTFTTQLVVNLYPINAPVGIHSLLASFLVLT